MRRLLPLALLACATAANAHLIVDMGVAISAPPFAASRSNVTYTIIVTDYAYDLGVGIVMTDTLPANAEFVSASGADFNCTQSNGTVTCSAEQLTPGPHLVTIAIKAPASGIAHDAASLQSLGSSDPNRKNDNAAVDTIIFDPAACSTAAPQLVAPTDGTELAAGAVDLVWSAVIGAKSYRVWSGVEGARATVVAETTATQFHRDAETGWTEWWVEAVFESCPPIASEHRHFLSHGSPARLNVITLAGRADSPGDDDGTLATARFRTPASVGIDLDGNIYVTDSEASTIRKITADGTVSTAMGIAGQTGANDGTRGYGTLNHPRALAVTLGGYVYIADTDNNIVRQFYPSGNGVIFGAFLGTLPAAFKAPAGIAVGSNGTVYVSDTANDLVRQVTQPNSVVSTIAGKSAGFNAPTGIAVDASGNLFVADGNDNVIRRIARDGSVSTFAGVVGQAGMSDGLGAVARFNRPTALAFDAIGNLYVADTGNNAIRKIAPSTLVTTVIAPGTLNVPSGLAFDSSGRMLIADSGNHVIRATTATPLRRRGAQH